MFDGLSEKFSSLFRNLSGKGKITESNVRQAMEEVRTALLEADVHVQVVQSFCDRVIEQAIGSHVLASLEPGHQMVKIVFDQLVQLIGPADSTLFYVDPPPTVIMMCGLQGSGKTTTCGKLALYLKSKGKNPLLVAADTQRPAAVDQLATLADQVGVPVYREDPGNGPVQICRRSVDFARANGRDVVILDTAGRLHIDEALMAELRQINQVVRPHQILLVVDAMVGQDAVNSARAFNSQLELDGVILTKFDSDTRGGAALSVKEITGKPIKFLGVGEKLAMLEEFHPDRVAQRILGMGDVLTLVEKAQQQFDAQEAEKMQEKISKATFTLDDFLQQMRSFRKMGPMKQLLGLLPGAGSALKDVDLPEEELDRTEAIIQSMTRREKESPDVIDGGRRRRIAAGSGTDVRDVSQLIKGFMTARTVARKLSGMSMSQRMAMMRGMGDGGIPGMTGMGHMGDAAPAKQHRLSPEQKRKLRDKRRRGK